MFSFVSMPFSLKIFWAPIVDSVYFQSVGRRRSWIIPIQIICGFLLIYCATDVGAWLGDIPAASSEGEQAVGSGANVPALTLFFVFQFFLMATQDVAVDGWALTLLSAKNVGYAMVCNNIGQSLGSYMSFNGLISFTDPVWCERHSGMLNAIWPGGYTPGTALVTLESFIALVGWLFVFSTILVVVLKSEPPETATDQHAHSGVQDQEKPPDELEAPAEGSDISEPVSHEDSIAGALTAIKDTAKLGMSLFSLSSVQLLCLVIITRKIGTAVVDASLSLKLQEYGMPKVDLVTFSTLSLLLSLLLPSFIKITRPLELWLLLFKCKLALDLGSWMFFQYSASYYQVLHANHTEGADAPPLSWPFFLSFGAITIGTQIVNSLMFTCMGFFFNTVADASIGGTYITLLNAVMNLGHLAPSSLVLYLMPQLTRSLSYVSTGAARVFFAGTPFVDAASTGLYVTHSGDVLRLSLAAMLGWAPWPVQQCTDISPDTADVCSAVVVVDGFTIVVFISTVLGVAWYLAAQRTLRRLQKLEKSSWTLPHQKQRDV